MLDALTGDLVTTPSNDFMLVSGAQLIEQRMRIRLKIPLGTWALDPTGGTLGSTVLTVTRMSNVQAAQQLPLLVKESLAPMNDIRIDDVNAWVDEADPRVVNFSVTYSVVDDQGNASDQLQFSDNVVVTQ